MDLQFIVDESLCIGCGECAKDCPFSLLEMNEDIPAISKENEEVCLQCQHCLAVCSTGALSIMDKNPADSLPLAGAFAAPGQLSALMKGRRSVRRYQKLPVSSEEIAELLDTAAYAPTAVNNRQVLFTVIENPEVMEKISLATYAALQEKIDNGGLPKGAEHIEEIVQEGLRTGQDTIFRGAPHLLIASSPKTELAPDVDCLIALNYFELLAASMGIGTLWCGLAKWAMTMIAPEILTKLGVPGSHQIGYMMVFGRPDVTYHRTVQRGPALINRVARFD